MFRLPFADKKVPFADVEQKNAKKLKYLFFVIFKAFIYKNDRSPI